jgi:CBS domain-containing protein
MQVQEIMSRQVELIGPNTTIRDAARKMRADNLGALPVGENDRLVGMVTDRDIVMRGVAEGALSRQYDRSRGHVRACLLVLRRCRYR